MQPKSSTAVRLVAFLTLLWMSPYSYYLFTYVSERSVVLHRYSPTYALFLLIYGSLLLPFAVVLLLPHVQNLKRVAVAFFLCWALLLTIFVAEDLLQRWGILGPGGYPQSPPHGMKDSAIVVFHGFRWFYFICVLVGTFLASGGLLRGCSEKLWTRWKAAASGGAVISFGLFSAVGLCEVGLRLTSPKSLQPRFANAHEFYQYHPLLGWSNRPCSSGYLKCSDFEHRVDINRKGLRDKDYSYARRPGVPRVLCLGDSFTWGYGVEPSKSFAKLLENEFLKSVEVINAGVVGYGTAQEWLWLREEAIKYRPDLVILSVFANDFEDNTKIKDGYEKPLCAVENGVIKVRNVPVPRKRYHDVAVCWQATFNRYSYAYRLFDLAWKGLQARIAAKKSPQNPSAQTPGQRSFAARRSAFKRVSHVPGEDVTEALLLEIGRLCAKTGAGLLVVLIPERQEMRPDDIYERLAWPGGYQQARAICRRHQVRCLELLPVLARYEERGQRVYFDVDIHWNEKGHRIVAEAICQKIMEDRLLQGMKTASSNEKR